VLTILQRHQSYRLTLEEVDGLVGDEIPCEILCSVHTAHNERAVAVGAPEEFKVRRGLPADALAPVLTFLSFSSGFITLEVASISTTLRIMATASLGFTLDLRPSLTTEVAASSRRPFRTNHQGDSGARKMRIASGVGNIH